MYFEFKTFTLYIVNKNPSDIIACDQKGLSSVSYDKQGSLQMQNFSVIVLNFIRSKSTIL
jgi:hypothetical protein